jgi:hypothetical protein
VDGAGVLLGVQERLPGAYGGAVIHADYTHSLIGAVLLSALFGGVAAVRYGRRGGVVLSLVAFSHWILDLPLHRADMPIFPGNAGHLPRLGFGLWRYPAASAALELGVVLMGAALYWRAASNVAQGDASMLRRAHLCGGLVLCCGLLTLGLNFAGM